MTGKQLLARAGFIALVGVATVSFVDSKLASASGGSPNTPGLYVLPDAGVNNDVPAGQRIGFDFQGGDSLLSGSNTSTLVANLPSNGGLSWSVNWATQPCSIAGPAGSQVLTCTFTMQAPYTHLGVDVISATSSSADGAVNITGTLSEGGTAVATARFAQVIG
jgi:hypothetical protein